MTAPPTDDDWSSPEPGLEAHPLIPNTPEALFREAYTPIVHSLTLIGGSQAAAEDATQDAFAEACIRWKRISQYDNPAAWIRRVAINKLRKTHRSRLRGEAALQRMANLMRGEPEPQDGGTDLVNALRSLPYKQRVATVLYYVNGLKISEVAKAMGITDGSVNQHLSRARAALKAHLETVT